MLRVSGSDQPVISVSPTQGTRAPRVALRRNEKSEKSLSLLTNLVQSSGNSQILCELCELCEMCERFPFDDWDHGLTSCQLRTSTLNATDNLCNCGRYGKK